ncbi:MAG: thrombospondin type 3 repeat-containing protein [Dehalococcoidia bacterium]|nr:thrombospondin type 3 repeat-containing protein [Dehalococcoidia bacterium]
MELSGRRPILMATVFAVLAAALALFVASSDTPKAEAASFFDITFTVKNCNALPRISPFSDAGFLINGTDTDSDTVADCNPGEGPDNEILTANTITDLTTRLCVPGRSAVPDCPASAGTPNLGAMNFSSVANFIPNGYQINCKGACPATMPSDTLLGADLAVGELAGGGDNSVHLQAATPGDCLSTFPVPFIFFNVALPGIGLVGEPSVAGNPDPRTSANIAFPRNEGQPNRFGAWATGAPPIDGIPNNVSGPGDFKADYDTLSVQQYPSYLIDLFDPDYIPGIGDNADAALPGGAANLPAAVPIAVYGGMTIPDPASADWVPLYFVQFAPGQLANGAGLWTGTHPYLGYTAGLGAPNFAILNDPTAIKSSIGTILDFCSHVRSTTMLLGIGKDPDALGPIVGGHTRFKTPITPADVIYTGTNEARSLRDADGDGRENSFDTCPMTAEPLAPVTFDSDGDGIYDSCDPGPVVPCLPLTCSTNDHDGDGFSNQQDNCPLVANGGPPIHVAGDGQRESELSQLAYPADGGPKSDGIGDTCEATTTWTDVFTNNTGTTVNDLHLVFPTGKRIFSVFAILGGTAPGTWDWQIDGHALNTNAADCATHAADETVDYTATGGTTVPPGGVVTVIVTTCAPQTSLSVTAQWTLGGVNTGSPFVVINTGDPNTPNGTFMINTQTFPKTIHKGNGALGCANGIWEDTDCDGFTRLWEVYSGTTPADNCNADVTLHNEVVDAWAPDNNDSMKADLSDILAYIPVYGTTPTTTAIANHPEGSVRYDMNSSNKIDLSDILMFIPYFNVTCV